MLTRRRFLFSGSAAATAATLHKGFAQEVSSAQEVVIAFKAGAVRGLRTKDAIVLRGVPFAKPPVGSLRFRSPVTSGRWDGTLDATRFRPAAPQNGGGFAKSEDCLYLNIWSPDTSGPHPVLVWLHGGGFLGGRATEPMFDGTHFTREGIVCITVAYRLGALGFMDVEPLLGSVYQGSATNGLQDIVVALRWIQENIVAFGGDPNRVTLAGQSAGAKLTDLLLGVPAAAPLFHQAISESGGADRVWVRERSFEVAKGFAERWTWETKLPVKAIAEADVSPLMSVQASFLRDWPVHFPFRGEIDGRFIPRSPLDAIRAGAAKGKRVLIGTNTEESAFFIGPHPAHDPGANDLGNLTVAEFQSVYQKYDSVYPSLSRELLRIRATTAEEYWMPSMRVAEAATAGGAQVFLYRLDLPGHDRFAGLTPHVVDLPLVWENEVNAHFTEVERRMARIMHKAWVEFIKGNAPAAEGLPLWPAFTLKQRETMLLNSASSVQNDPQAKERVLWDGKFLH